MKRANERSGDPRPWSTPKFTEVRLDLEATAYVNTDDPEAARRAAGERGVRLEPRSEAASR